MELSQVQNFELARAPIRNYFLDDKSHQVITIVGKSPAEVYAFWTDLENFPRFMKDITEVTHVSEGKSHWVFQLKSGFKVEWDAEIVEKREGIMLSWQSLPDSEVETKGSVWFTSAPRNEGTIVSLSMDYSVPGGKLTELLTKITAEDPNSLSKINLRRLKAYLETGEIPTTEGQSSGREETPAYHFGLN